MQNKTNTFDAGEGLDISPRIMGAMLGLACGDALEAPAEFKSQATVQQQYVLLKDMIGGGVWAPGSRWMTQGWLCA